MRYIPRVICAFLVLPIQPVVAQEQVSTKSRNGLLQSQMAILDGRASDQYASSDRLSPPRSAGFGMVPQYAGSYSGPFLTPARAAAIRYGVPVDLFLRLVQQESAWDPTARSNKGAFGLAQLMPETARHLGVDPSVPAENLDGGARYLRAQYDTFGSWPLALAAYNAGPGAVIEHQGIPPYPETVTYVRAIWGQ